ncbi:MAG: hypothetical protein K1X33_02915 [Methanobacteriaceae archaeon]|nr:hypothetical protein [Methanobacteriaceae archaeon]
MKRWNIIHIFSRLFQYYCFNFTQNNAANGGGALYFGDSSLVNVTFSNFNNKTAD